MHFRELVDLAAVLATHASAILRQANPLPRRYIEQYWTSSKCRQDRWARSLQDYSSKIQHGQAGNRPAHWRAVRPALEEILTGELLTRIWTALAAAHDRLRGTDEVEPVVRSVFVGHLEARHRALNLMVYGQERGVEEAENLNRLRRRTERWTDLLLGQLVGHVPLEGLAFDPTRATDFAADRHFQYQQGNGALTWQLVLASLRAAFRHGLSVASPNPDLNERIAESILFCFPPDVLDEADLPQQLWLIRLSGTARRTERMIQQYLSTDAPGRLNIGHRSCHNRWRVED